MDASGDTWRLLSSTSLGERRRDSARIVAFTALAGLFEPSDLATASLTPAISSTARTPPPAIRPVPAGAGLISTFAAPKRTRSGGGIGVRFIGTLIIFLP